MCIINPLIPAMLPARAFFSKDLFQVWSACIALLSWNLFYCLFISQYVFKCFYKTVFPQAISVPEAFPTVTSCLCLP